MTDDMLPTLEAQVLVAARLAGGAALAWLVVLALVALRHRRSPDVALAALRRLGAPTTLCRVVLLVVCVGVAQPAYATAPAPGGSSGQDSSLRLAEALDGLPSPALPAPGPPVVVRPERPAAATSSPETSRPVARPGGAADRCDHVVRAGDSLWSITEQELRAGSAPAIERGWRDLYAANRRTIGADPDLIRPGTRLDTSSLAPGCD
ncbi:LysM peptidoglycan-binding domain-containing protein [Nocardioidaceae bacterium]|nr:LysM peptidoglycan-binding domain-containing protein [Nocardioidaceae bacterium]